MDNFSTSFGGFLGGAYQRIRTAMPHVVFTLLGMLYCMVPPSLIGLWPNIFLTALYFWIIYVPGHISFAVVMVVSCLHDVYTGLPLGFHGLLYGCFYFLVNWQARKLMDKGFVALWVSFGVFVFLTVSIGHLIMILFDRGVENFIEVQFHTLITFTVAPFIYLVVNPFIRELRS